jgi:uncharacterized protein YdeI (YjbR/CyaY-like superfamily)
VALFILQKIGNYLGIVLDDNALAQLTAKGNKRVLCTLSNTIQIHAAIMRTKQGTSFIMIATRHLKQLKLTTGAELEVRLQIDESELQFHVPEEFSEVMATDPEAEKIFYSLTDGNKRGLIALVNAVKSPDKKIERALKIAERLKMGITAPQKVMT